MLSIYQESKTVVTSDNSETLGDSIARCVKIDLACRPNPQSNGLFISLKKLPLHFLN